MLDKFPLLWYNILVNRLWVGKPKCDLAVVWKNEPLVWYGVISVQIPCVNGSW